VPGISPDVEWEFVHSMNHHSDFAWICSWYFDVSPSHVFPHDISGQGRLFQLRDQKNWDLAHLTLHTCNQLLDEAAVRKSWELFKRDQIYYLNGMEWNGMDWNEMEWNGMEWNGMKWNEMEWNEMEWNEMKWRKFIR
jgi:hypothetical protein